MATAPARKRARPPAAYTRILALRSGLLRREDEGDGHGRGAARGGELPRPHAPRDAAPETGIAARLTARRDVLHAARRADGDGQHHACGRRRVRSARIERWL